MRSVVGVREGMKGKKDWRGGEVKVGREEEEEEGWCESRKEGKRCGWSGGK